MQVATYVILIVLQGLILISLWTILYQAVKQQGRLLLRLDDLDHRLTQAGLGAGPGTSTGQGGLEVGTAASSPRLPDPDGRLISLDDFRGKRVLLVHWNPDCAFCELLAPDLAQFQADQAGPGPARLPSFCLSRNHRVDDIVHHLNIGARVGNAPGHDR